MPNVRGFGDIEAEVVNNNRLPSRMRLIFYWFSLMENAKQLVIREMNI